MSGSWHPIPSAPIMRRRDDLAQFLPQRRNVSGTIYFPQ